MVANFVDVALVLKYNSSSKYFTRLIILKSGPVPMAAVI